MSHLYSMFAKQVSSYCKTNIDTPVAKCKRDLLVYGVDKLERMTDLHLDAMDPYQRGANDISKLHYFLTSFLLTNHADIHIIGIDVVDSQFL